MLGKKTALKKASWNSTAYSTRKYFMHLAYHLATELCWLKHLCAGIQNQNMHTPQTSWCDLIYHSVWKTNTPKWHPAYASIQVFWQRIFAMFKNRLLISTSTFFSLEWYHLCQTSEKSHDVPLNPNSWKCGACQHCTTKTSFPKHAPS